jgi:hypothetical protein
VTIIGSVTARGPADYFFGIHIYIYIYIYFYLSAII